MTNKMIIVRCYSKKEGNHWVAVCIDLSLAAQAESQEAAISKLESMLTSYMHDAVTIDKDYFQQLIERKAPIDQVLFWNYLKFSSKFKSFCCNFFCKNKEYGHVFSETFPSEFA